MNNSTIEPATQTVGKNLKSQIIQGDCLKVLPALPPAAMIFADPPDNIGCKYEGFDDRWPDGGEYCQWLYERIHAVIWPLSRPGIIWLSINNKWLFDMAAMLHGSPSYQTRLFPWRYTFGQHNSHDCGSGYRPILRFMRAGAKLYPNAIREPSARQTKYGDKRADPRGRVPDDVWEFSRVCGTFKERKAWHPCQHPKALLRRMVLLSTKPGDLVIDLFAGSGNMLEVCRELGRDCIGIEISKFYCEKIAETTGAELIHHEEHEETRSNL